MATVIQIKRSTGTTAPSNLYHGELAYTSGTGSEKLYVGAGGVAGDGYAQREDIIGGKYFTDYLDHTVGTLTASSAILVDSNLAIDTLNIGNSTTAGGTLKLNEGTNNGSNFVALKSPNSLAASNTYTLPTAYGSAGQFLKQSDASGTLAWDTVNQYIDLAGDTGTDQYNTAETLTFTGGTGLDTAITDNEVTINITNSGVDTAQIADDAVTNAKLSTNGETTLGSTTLTLGSTTTAVTGMTALTVDNLTIDGNTVQSDNSNGDINLTPNGTGTVIVPSGYEDRSGFTDQSLANKAYVDQVAQGLDVKGSVVVATTANLSATYDNGTSGIGATLTNSGSQAAFSADGVSPSQNDRVLVKDQTNAAHNGIYTLTTVGTGSTNWVLTRATDVDEPDEFSGGAFVFVEQGTANADNGYVFTHNGTPTFGTTDFDVAQFSGAGQITAGAALSKSGNQLDVEVDDSSIEVSGDSLQVKALGVTNAMLAGSIATSKLADTRIYFTDETSTQGIVNLNETLEFLTGTAVNTVASGRTLTISVDDATTSAKGIASFSSDNFTVSSGDVTVTTIDGGTY